MRRGSTLLRVIQDLPIPRKPNAPLLLTCGAALLLACVGFVAYEQVTLRQIMARDLSMLTDLFDDNVAPGLAFNDAKSIEQTLKALDANPRILAAAVYDKTGQVVATYERA